MKHSTFKAAFRAPYFVCLTNRLSLDVLCWQFCACVCSLACPGNPSLRCSRFPVGKADIPVLVNQAVPNPLRLQFRKAGFQEAKQKSDVLRGAGVRGRGGVAREQTCVCGTLCVNQPSLVREVQATLQTLFEERLSPHSPLAVSLLKHRSSRCQPLVTMAKLNNGQFVNRTMCVCLRPTTAFPPSPFFSLSSLNLGQGNCL